MESNLNAVEFQTYLTITERMAKYLILDECPPTWLKVWGSTYPSLWASPFSSSWITPRSTLMVSWLELMRFSMA